ncbi:hypothetical protein NDU88_001785 [Pleurodeles waltl]|uniref:Uncharacterized protein n=1 Tax=Pleurodeles waltl TaxID=8319 RepID=A0AAV7M960_PLEWA|nr:hypothetical protein NDU88_001785 [Pleurodeles waltl]
MAPVAPVAQWPRGRRCLCGLRGRGGLLGPETLWTLQRGGAGPRAAWRSGWTGEGCICAASGPALREVGLAGGSRRPTRARHWCVDCQWDAVCCGGVTPEGGARTWSGGFKPEALRSGTWQHLAGRWRLLLEIR